MDPSGLAPWQAPAGAPAAADRDGTADPAGTAASVASGTRARAAMAVDGRPGPGGPDSGPRLRGARRRSIRREATRQRVLDAAREVFAERGVIGATVEDICERAGYTRGAFYSNFADKDDVLDALVEREHARLLEHLDRSFALVEREVAEAEDVPSVVASIVDRILRSMPIDRHLSLVQTELEILAIRRPEQADRFLRIDERFRARIGAFVDDAMRRHGRVLLVDPAVLTDAIVAIAERSVRRALLQGGDADPDAMASAVLPGLLLALSRHAADG